MSLLSFSRRDTFRFLYVLLLLALAFVTAGCGPHEGAGPSDAGPAACPPGTMMLNSDGSCQNAGLPPDMQCPPGETPLDNGGCQPAGVPPDACGQGFEPDGQGGCNPILPVSPCPPGQMAVPGETQCHEVAPCGNGDYGMIPIEATTQFVKGDYPWNDSNGTQMKPWKLIQDGIYHAKAGAIVAVAAGSYKEDIPIISRPVRLWGRCPALVEVVGTGVQTAALGILSPNASKSEVHNLAITGPRFGILMTGSSDVVVDRVWIHDTMERGLDVNDGLGPSSITVAASLIETTKETGIFVQNSNATIEATVVRATQPRDDGMLGSGISIQENPVTHERSTVTLRGSLVEQNHDTGVDILGADATIEATIVRGTLPSKDVATGIGISFVDVIHSLDTSERVTLTLRTSLVDQNHGIGVLIQSSKATIEATTVRATQPHSDGTDGQGIVVQDAGVTVVGVPPVPERATLTLRTSLVEQNHDAGVHVVGSDATIEATIVRATQPRSDGRHGRGIEVEGDAMTPARSTVILRNSLVEQNHDVGVGVFGSDATIDATIVRDTQPWSDGTGGTGIHAQGVMQARSTLTLRASLLERNHNAGVVVTNSDGTIEACVVRDTRPDKNGLFGDGVLVASSIPETTTTITSTRVESNARAGISNFSGEVLFISNTVQCNAIDLDGEEDTMGMPFTFDGSKGNLCGCENPDPTCPVLSAHLSAPEPIPPIKQ